MDLDAIAVFIKVVQAGSFSQAAKLLGMPNSTVSAKVSLLEKQLGVTLLQRTTRKLRLTQAGETHFKRCLQALEELQAAESELATAQREPQGLLRLLKQLGRTKNFESPVMQRFSSLEILRFVRMTHQPSVICRVYRRTHSGRSE